MTSSYPGSLDNLATNKTNSTPTIDDHANHHNDLADAVNKIEAELGTNPSGNYSNLVTRLNANSIFNVKDYGAIGDGVANDTSSINSAITAAVNGGIIFFPPGTYVTTGNHVITGGKIQIVGSGVASTNISHSGNNVCFQFTAPGITNQRAGIKHLLITGNSGNAACGIEFRDLNYGGWAEHVRVVDYTVYGGILLHNFASNQFTEGIQLDDVSTANCLFGIAFYRTNGTDSFNSTHFKNLAINVPNNGTAISVGALSSSGQCLVYNST
jgi:hypothetical protein